MNFYYILVLFNFLKPIRLTKTAIAKTAHPTVIPTITPVAIVEAVLLSVVVVTLVELIADFRANNIKLKNFKFNFSYLLNYCDKKSKKTQISLPYEILIVLVIS